MTDKQKDARSGLKMRWVRCLCVCIETPSSLVHDAKQICNEQMVSTTLIGIQSGQLRSGATKYGAKHHTSCSCVSNAAENKSTT